MIYADYEFYSGCYYGSINEEDFQRLPSAPAPSSIITRKTE